MNIAITQRIYFEPYNGFTYDTLQTAWYDYLDGHTMVRIPNHMKVDLDKIVDQCDVFIIGGGQKHPIRDYVENTLIEKVYAANKPIIGICHGLRILTEYFGGSMMPIEDHQGTEHIVTYNKKYYTVNSYHKYAVQNMPTRLNARALAFDEQNYIESWVDEISKIGGTMWHPERGCMMPKEIGKWLNK
jgi:gamma-glutamyl-gamma-aminobutyrate hydrolase PuuD